MNASRDENRVTVLLATSSTDGKSVVPVYASSSHGLSISDGTIGSSLPFVNAERDENRTPTLWAVSSVDGITPIPIYADSNNKLLVKST